MHDSNELTDQERSPSIPLAYPMRPLSGVSSKPLKNKARFVGGCPVHPLSPTLMSGPATYLQPDWERRLSSSLGFKFTRWWQCLAVRLLVKYSAIGGLTTIPLCPPRSPESRSAGQAEPFPPPQAVAP
jgi:hypothetical protein